MAKNIPENPVPSLHDLYPHLSQSELEAVGETLDRFIDHGLRMYERIRSDPEAYAQLTALTTAPATPTIEGMATAERSQPPAATHNSNG